jgi:hypothetical protein
VTGPLTRRLEQAGFQADPPVSGRSAPRPAPLPAGVSHDVRFDGVALSGNGYIRARCTPCSWSVALDNGHDLPDLIRLTAQHAGETDITISTVEVLLDVLRPLARTP